MFMKEIGLVFSFFEISQPVFAFIYLRQVCFVLISTESNGATLITEYDKI
jgi:hypothetical protein